MIYYVESRNADTNSTPSSPLVHFIHPTGGINFHQTGSHKQKFKHNDKSRITLVRLGWVVLPLSSFLVCAHGLVTLLLTISATLNWLSLLHAHLKVHLFW